MDRSAELGQARISTLLLKFSIPAIIGMMVNALYNIVDRIFIGQGVGPLGIAGATVGFPIMLVQMAFGMLIGLGGNALVSIKLGQQRKAEAERVLGNALVLLVAASIVIMIPALWFMKPLLRLFGASDTIMPYAVEYLRIILLGTVFQAVGFGLNNFIRGEGNPKMAMKTMFIGAGLNTVLDPLFIFVFHMGVAGAALATIISQAVSMVWVLLYFRSANSLLKLRRANLRLHREVVQKIFLIGSAPFSMHMVASVINAILNNQLQRYGGDLALSVMGINYSLAMLMLMPIFGINQGSQPIIGYNYGAQKFDRVKHAVKMAILAATSVVAVGFLITQLFPKALIQLFNHSDAALIEMGRHSIRIYFLVLPVVGFQVVSANYFMATGKPSKAIFLTLSRQIIFLIPAVLILPLYFKLDGIWMASPVSDFMSALLTAIFLFIEMRHLGQQHTATINAEQDWVDTY
jgi:putative MATE family efflux protein